MSRVPPMPPSAQAVVTPAPKAGFLKRAVKFVASEAADVASSVGIAAVVTAVAT